MTLVGYFNSMRELAACGVWSMTTCAPRSKHGRPALDSQALSARYLDELTSRLGSTRHSAACSTAWRSVFDPATDGTSGDTAKTSAHIGETQRPLDVLLATNMISVGVDVQRLGLMVVAGQPKTTAEYIQATSRVGRVLSRAWSARSTTGRARATCPTTRRFEHYHATFYKHVEALSVTPFAPRALDRGLTALLVSLVRQSGHGVQRQRPRRRPHADIPTS